MRLQQAIKYKPHPYNYIGITNGINANINKLTPQEITKAICEYFNLQYERVFLKSRKREIVTVRHLSMYFIREYTKIPLSSIGFFFKGLDHTTVIHGINTVNDLKDTDMDYRNDFYKISELIRLSI